MSHKKYYQYFDNLEEFDNLPAIRNMPRKQQRLKQRWNPYHKPQGISPEAKAQLEAQLAEQSDGKSDFQFSYQASHHEREWILNSLGGFYENQWIGDVLQLIKGGKEAHVYQCLANTSAKGLSRPFIAAKVYRPRRFRSLKNDQLYREGREILDSDGRRVFDDRVLHAIQAKSNYGLEQAHISWIEHEYRALSVLHAAGGDVPLPYERGNNAILMAYIGGENLPAPTLNEVELDTDQAMRIFKRILRNIDLMLDNHLVHADLSAYNILYWKGRITLIDFPQVIDPYTNKNAWSIFQRDVRRICEYFARQGVKSNPHQIAVYLWKAHGYRLGPEIPPMLMGD